MGEARRMTVIKNSTTGRYSTDASEVMTHVRKPVFVDNAVHFGRLSIQTTDKPKVTVTNSNARTFHVMPERSYHIVEGEGGLQLTHTRTPGHNYTGLPFYRDNKISSTNLPALFYDRENKNARLLPNSTTTATNGVGINLTNMKGRTLLDIGFSGTDVRVGQPVDVGFRTSDLAIKLTESVATGITSVNIARPRNVSNSGRRAHSTRFIGHDFHNTNLMTALRFLSRHDNRMVMLDRFGSLLYVPISFSESTIELDSQTQMGTSVDSGIDNAVNAVTIQGLPLALNDEVVITVHDGEGQVEEIRQDVATITDYTVRTSLAARRVALKILKGQALQKGAISSKGHFGALGLRPGMVVTIDDEPFFVTETRHMPLLDMTDLSLLSVETGIEGVLQGISEGSTVAADAVSPDVFSQEVTENFSFFGKVQLRLRSEATVRIVGTDAFLVGGNKGNRNRGLIGKAGKAIGVGKSEPEDI